MLQSQHSKHIQDDSVSFCSRTECKGTSCFRLNASDAWNSPATGATQIWDFLTCQTTRGSLTCQKRAEQPVPAVVENSVVTGGQQGRVPLNAGRNTPRVAEEVDVRRR